MELLERISELFQHEPTLATDDRGEPADLELQAATAILLLEAAYGDAEYVWAEHRAIVKGLEREFGIGKQQALALMGRAEEIRPPTVTLKDVTDVIASRFSKPQRETVMELVWRVIDADSFLEDWEESFAEHLACAVGLSPEEGRRARTHTRGSSRDER